MASMVGIPDISAAGHHERPEVASDGGPFLGAWNQSENVDLFNHQKQGKLGIWKTNKGD